MGDRDSCEVRNWKVFTAGYWKDDYYSPARVARVPANFARLRGAFTPVGKLGHDRTQRFAKSLGFPNVGRIVSCVPTPDGGFGVTITGIPTDVGAEINAGRIASGSVDLLPSYADPADPSKTIQGPILAGVSFLGEERPAVHSLPAPKAVFADGTPVPPARSAAKWLTAMAECMRADSRDSMSFSIGGHTGAVLAFADFKPLTGAKTMDPTAVEMDASQLGALRAKLQAAGLDDDTIDLVMKAFGPVPPAPAVGAGLESPNVAQMRAKLAADAADAKKNADEKQAAFAAFSAGVAKTAGRGNPILAAMVAKGSALDRLTPALAADTRKRLAGGN